MLTELAIKALKPRDIRYYVSDAHGLALEVFPSGSMAWRYRYRHRLEISCQQASKKEDLASLERTLRLRRGKPGATDSG
jgi:hypothetical protein